jgi:hypothetical protein
LLAFCSHFCCEYGLRISLAKGRLQTPDGHERGSRHPCAGLIAAVWREVDPELARSNSWDFDDLIGFAMRLL